ncbi:MAG: flavodoxin domain-containing protein [Butyricicoccaceae bacterium]
MTKPIVLYHTIYGSARRYAEWIAAGLGTEIAQAKTAVIELSAAPIFFVGSLYAGKIAGIGALTGQNTVWNEREIHLCILGMQPEYNKEHKDEILAANFSDQQIEHITSVHFLPGAMDINRLGLKHRFMMKGMASALSCKSNPTEQEKMFIHLSKHAEDWVDREAIAPILACFMASERI